MTSLILVLTVVAISSTVSANTIFRCISNKVLAGGGISGEIYAGIDLEVKSEGNSGLLNGEYVSVKPLEINASGEVTGIEETSTGTPIHDKLELVANLAIKTKLYLRINTNGENEGLPRGYIESLWGTGKIFWRAASGIFVFSYRNPNSDCKEILN